MKRTLIMAGLVAVIALLVSDTSSDRMTMIIPQSLLSGHGILSAPPSWWKDTERNQREMLDAVR